MMHNYEDLNRIAMIINKYDTAFLNTIMRFYSCFRHRAEMASHT